MWCGGISPHYAVSWIVANKTLLTYWIGLVCAVQTKPKWRYLSILLDTSIYLTLWLFDTEECFALPYSDSICLTLSQSTSICLARFRFSRSSLDCLTFPRFSSFYLTLTGSSLFCHSCSLPLSIEIYTSLILNQFIPLRYVILSHFPLTNVYPERERERSKTEKKIAYTQTELRDSKRRHWDWGNLINSFG